MYVSFVHSFNNYNNNNNNNNQIFYLSTLNLLNDLGRKISSVSGDDREGHFLFQRLSVILQRYNAVLLHESFVQSDGLDL